MQLRLPWLLCFAPLSMAAQTTPVAPAFATTGAFLALSVPDLEASAAWYAEKLGLQVIMDPPAHDGIRVKVLEGGGLIVELLHNPAAVPLRTAAPSISHTTQVHGLFKAGFMVTDYDRTLATLRERGVEIAMGPFPARDGQRANVIIRDNAGNLLQLFAR
jgi:catechol 2,3-dioxygenase-like lactoylglutathione lyase family enzyme